MFSVWFAGKFRQEFRRTVRECTPSNQSNDRRPNQPLSYACTANGYRSAPHSRREQTWRAEMRVSWVKKAPSTIAEGPHDGNESPQGQCSLGLCTPQTRLRSGWAILYCSVIGQFVKQNQKHRNLFLPNGLSTSFVTTRATWRWNH